MKKLMLIIGAFGLMTVLLTPSGVNADLVLTPSDDTYVDLNDQDTNKDGYGLVVDYSGRPCIMTRLGYLRFDVSSIYTDVGTGTELRLYVTFEAYPGGDVSAWSTGDDWNGPGVAGMGDETTLMWSNAPSPISELDTQATEEVGNWIEFSGAALSNYINLQRSANDGNDVASFAIQWDDCPTSDFDSITFEDHEAFGNGGNLPELYPLNPTAVRIALLSVDAAPRPGWHWVIFGLLGTATSGLLLSDMLSAGRRRRLHNRSSAGGPETVDR